MRPFVLKTPVVLLVFNRPELTARVFSAVRDACPQRILVIADGPRANRPDDQCLCAKVRDIVEQVDWPCEVLRNYSDINLGCRDRVSSGLDWAFEQVEEAIILEDDCLPEISFFRYCQELLELYRYNERIMMICGSNLLGVWNDESQSYHYSHYDWVWGWASWRRAWRHYDVEMPQWGDESARETIRGALAKEEYYKLRAKTFQQAFRGKIDTWDYQWTFARILQGGLAIIPSKNLVSNIGYGDAATHTIVMDKELSNMATYPVSFPLKHVSGTPQADLEYDMSVVNMIQRGNTFARRLIRFLGLVKLKFMQ